MCQNYRIDSGCKFGDKCLFRHAEADSQPSKKSRASGQKPHLTKQRKKILCTTGNVVPLVVPGLSSNSGTSSSSTSLPQDSSSTPPSPASSRSDETYYQAPGDRRDDPPPKKKNEDNNQASEDQLGDLLEWLEEFTDGLENTEVAEPANISQDSDSERPTKVACKKHGIKTHFSEDRNCEVCKRTKMMRAPCRRRTGEAVPRAEKFGHLITADQ